MGVCYRLLGQEKEIAKHFYRELKAASKSPAPVLVGDFNYPDICWRHNTVKHKPSRRFLESLEDYFLTQEVDNPTRNGVLIDLILINREDLFGHGNDRL